MYFPDFKLWITGSAESEVTNLVEYRGTNSVSIVIITIKPDISKDREL